MLFLCAGEVRPVCDLQATSVRFSTSSSCPAFSNSSARMSRLQESILAENI